MSMKLATQPVIVSALAAFAAAAAPANALAPAQPPAVSTGRATQVSYASAVVSGAVNPHGAATTYYFQYGTTPAYGLQTAVAGAGEGTAAAAVSTALTGLAPVTVYHYRLVALNGAGARAGADRTFKTAAVPLSLQILGAPNPTVYATPTVIEGTLSGTGNANQAVVLQQNPFPYVQGFVNVGNPELTNSTGGFAFPLFGLTASTEFRVITSAKVPVVSPTLIESVAVSVTIRTRPAPRRRHVRISGTVTPNVEGMPVEILRLVNGHAIRVATTFARRLSAANAHYAAVIRRPRHGGIYEAFVRVTNGAQTSAYSPAVFVHGRRR
jgi:hypothetical protein